MAVDLEDEIVQDFLVEAGEISEKLAQQLIDLESAPDDSELLNSLFRGLHTIKGGAGFIGLDNLVSVCHRAEDVFNLLRQGERRVDANMMDIMLQVSDVVNAMFEQIQEGNDPDAAPDALIAALDAVLAGDAAAARPEPEPESEPESEPGPGPEVTGTPADAGATPDSDDITDEEFEALLDELEGKAPAADSSPATPPAAAADSDEITEDEFDALLDKLAAEKAAGTEAQPAASAPEPEVPAPAAAPAPVAVPDPAPAAKKAASADTTVRVTTRVLDRIMNMVGELVLARNRLSRLHTTVGDETLSQAVGNLDIVTSDLQNAVMQTRMQPIKKVFGRFPRVVRDLARTLNKDIVLEMKGEDTDLDKNLVEALADPLVHLVRNAVDHGVEMPDVREASGKPRQGTVRLEAEQAGNHILISIADDGAGMDAESLRRKVVEKGLMDEETAARLDDRECYNLIFLPGFSTKDQISDVSGRGVGMDVVKTRIAQLNGMIEVDSEPGKGSQILLKVPLTLAIMPTLMVMLQEQIFALPLVNVNEILDLDLNNTNMVDGQLTAIVRERPLPLFHLSRWLTSGHQESDGQGAHVVVVSFGTQKVGFVVDRLIGQEEVVIKPLGALLHDTRGLAGATITGEGKIALILDVPGLIQSYARRM